MDARRYRGYPPRKAIFIDVDGTLHINGHRNDALVHWMQERRHEGCSLTLWSARGEDYAIKAANDFHVSHLFDHIVSKPGAVVDDKGLDWLRETVVLGPNPAQSVPEATPER